MTQKKIEANILQALQGWAEFSFKDHNPFEELELYKQLIPSYGGSNLAGQHRIINKILFDGIIELKSTYEEGATILEHRFIEGYPVNEVALKLDLSVDQFKPRQRKSVKALSETILTQESQLVHNINEHARQFLPPTPQFSFGRQAELDTLLDLVLDQPDLFEISICGIGGIGKTHLATQLAHKILDAPELNRIAWLAFNPNTPLNTNIKSVFFDSLYDQLILAQEGDIPNNAKETAVRTLLEQNKTVVFIDNLETKEQGDQVYQLFGRHFDPLKIILTARYQALGEGSSYKFELNQLGLEDSIQIMKRKAVQLGIVGLLEDSENELSQLGQMVGGNPLAITIVMGLVSLLPISQVVAELESVDANEINDMYRHIYKRSWDMLTDKAQSLLKAMPLAGSNGLTLRHLEIGTGITRSDLVPALSELKRFSLLEIVGDLNEKRYGIHALTESFVRSDIIKG